MTENKLTRQLLIDLIDTFRDPSSHGRREPLAEKLQEQLPSMDILNLCESDLPSDTIVDFCLDFEKTQRILTRQELIDVVKAISSPDLTSEVEDMLLLETFVYNCRHPAGTDLIYDPDTIFGEGVEVTPEMIVDTALAGR